MDIFNSVKTTYAQAAAATKPVVKSATVENQVSLSEVIQNYQSCKTDFGGILFSKIQIYVGPNQTGCVFPGVLRPLWVQGSRIGPTYPPACRKRRLIGGSLFTVGCNPCQWKRGSWLLS